MINGFQDFILLSHPNSVEEEEEFVDLTSDKTKEIWEQNVQKSYQETVFYTSRSILNTTVTRLSSLWSKGNQQTSPELHKFMEIVIGKRVDVTLVAGGFFMGVVNVDKLDLKSTYVIPMLVNGIIGYHMTCFYVHPGQNGEVHVEFFDGKGLHIDDPLNKNARELYEAIVAKQHHDMTFKQLHKPIQFDVHNCGSLTAWFIDKRLNGFSFEDIEKMDAPDIEEFRTRISLLSSLTEH